MQNRIEAPVVEQEICVGCGFCCDGTMFVNAGLNQGERGHLPEKIEQASFSKGGHDYFRLPCKYFAGKCSIYYSKRAVVCSSYRCQLLKDLADGRISRTEALATVRDAMEMRDDIINEYIRLSGKEDAVHFRQILVELGLILKAGKGDMAGDAEYGMLLARCNIFEALLIKNFRSVEDFEKMIMK